MRGPGGKFAKASTGGEDKPGGLWTTDTLPARAAAPAATPKAEKKQAPAGGLKGAWHQAMKTAKVLTGGEIDEFRDDLIRGITQLFEFNDEFMTHTNKRGAKAEIWTAIPDNEIEILADYLLERGQRSVVIAQGVRGIVQTWRAYAALLILGPAAWESFVFYMQNGIGFPVGMFAAGGRVAS